MDNIQQNNSDTTLNYFVDKFEDALHHKNTQSAVKRAKQIHLLTDAALIYMLVNKFSEK